MRRNKLLLLLVLLPVLLFATTSDFSGTTKRSSHSIIRSAWVRTAYASHTFSATSDTMFLKPDSIIWYSFFSLYVKAEGAGTLKVEYQVSPFDSANWWNDATWFSLDTITDTCGYDIGVTSLISPVEYIKFRFTLVGGSLSLTPVWHCWN